MKILVVDDCKMTLFVITKTLKELGYTDIVTAENRILSIITGNYHCFGHSCEGRNPGSSYKYWIPAFAGVTFH